MKYRVSILPPKAKRMIGSAKLVITLHQGQEGDTKIEHKVAKAGDFDFEVPDGYEWIYSSSILGGNSFSLSVQYSNDTGSRKESYNPVPEKI